MLLKFIFINSAGSLLKLFSTIIFFGLFLTSCSVSKNYSPDKKFSKNQLQQDYSLLRTILEKKHPSLYWYTSRDSMIEYFEQGYKNIEDSMTELQFGWKIIAPLTNKIRCGHTSFTMSTGWNKFIKNRTIPSFPLHLKVWADTMIVIANLNTKDSVIKKGTLVTAINGVRNNLLLKKMFAYLTQDGYAENVNYTRLSINFPYFHRNIFGLSKVYSVQYIDSNGIEKKQWLPYYDPAADTTVADKLYPDPEKKLSRQKKIERIRSLKIDTSKSMATIYLRSFSKGHLQKFFKRSFKKLHAAKIENLVIDLRNNGGGDINNYVALTRYLKNSSFKVADTAASIAKNFRPYSKYINAAFFDRPGLAFLTKKGQDKKYHFGFWEKRVIKPRQKNHFSGAVYIITNGLTFSASVLFCHAVKGQNNVKLVGEETGGAWYGNSGIVIPDIILPNTRLKVRLPFFRLVQYNHVEKNGTGVLPDIMVNPTVRDVRNNIDKKMEVVKGMILNKSTAQHF